MALNRLVFAAPGLLLGLAIVPSCTPAAKSAAVLASSSAATGTAAATPRLTHTPSTIAARPAPPVTTTPRHGDPSGAALAEARLVSMTCQNASAQDIDARVREMRAAVDKSFQEWHDGQPQCWEDDREQYRERLERERDWSGQFAPRGATKSLAPDSYGSGYGGGDALSLASGAPVAPSAAQSAPVKEKSPARAQSASGTNNQVVGVDEADIVKTDGSYVYLVANGALRIVEALKPRLVSVTKVPGVARELFVEGDRAVVYTSSSGSGTACTYAYDCAFGGDGTKTTVSVFDLTSRTQPKLVRQIDLSGSLIAARRIGDAVHTVVSDGDTASAAYETWPADFEMCGTMEPEVRAKFAKLKADNERKIRAQTASFPTIRENGVEASMCNGGLLRTTLRDGQAFTSVVSFDLKDDHAKATSSTLESRPGAVFASNDSLYISVVHQKQPGNRWYNAYPAATEVSEVHKFRIGRTGSETKYVGSGMVPGHVLNQFAMDEWSGYLRIATSSGRVPDPGVESTVSILRETANGNLVRTGAIEHIAPGEDIRAVRFDDDRGYVVTFKKTDPLFVMDLYEPQAPKILGELKIPGFSTYIHRMDPEHLLSIGFDANDHGSFAYFDGVILQLFDVKNPTDPKLLHKEKIGTRGSSSAAATDHLAFNFFADRGLLALPMTVCEGGGDGVDGNTLAFSGLYVYDVDVERGFTRLGGVDHGTHGANCGTWWANATSQVKRSVFLDDLVYSIASDRVKVQRMDHFGEDLLDLPLDDSGPITE